MRKRRLSDVAAAIGGRLRGSDREVTGVVVDSRRASADALFFALRGERADGHAYMSEAFANGAAAAVVDHQAADATGPLIEVTETGRALLELAADERLHMDARVIAITGANGKTSTKDLLAAVLATGFRTYSNPASFNNEVGVPLTILGAPPETEVLVCEMGARRPGDVTALCEVGRPHVVVVTNVGVAHMEIFGTWDNIVAASAEPVEWVSAGGTAVLNVDDPVVRDLATRTRARVVAFGTSGGAEIRAEDINLDEEGRPAFTLVARNERERVELDVPGEHMVPNALAAAASGLTMGVSPAECAAALKGAHISAWRMETFTTAGGVRIVNDAYNANPESMAAGLRAARWMAREGRMVAVLGPMAELGPIAIEEHERVGELVVRLGVERLITVGEAARRIALAAIREGAPHEHVASYDETADAVADLRSWTQARDVVLVKGSRVAGLEKVAEALR